MKKIFLFITIGLLINSCSNDESGNENQTSGNSMLLTRTVSTDLVSGEVLVGHRTYVGNKISRISSTVGYTDFIYEGDFIKKQITYFTGSGLQSSDFLEYDSQGRQIERTSISGQSDSGYRRIYIYNPDGTITVNGYSGNRTVQNTLERSTKVYLVNGEADKIEFFRADGTLRETRTYEYDDKRSPESMVTGFTRVKEYLIGVERTEHNITLITHKYPNISETSGLSSQYTYNTQDMPEMMLLPGISRFEYFYE